ncbi:hypothetical protein WS83_15425 [Burkholderia sp. MSMB2042]|nr:hypothetical protein WS83_15425 [Burkholderia sp. MSMB2042]KVG98022.1 hypothetical protein WS82_27630 [Burkholderia sp. MSMB2041]
MAALLQSAERSIMPRTGARPLRECKADARAARQRPRARELDAGRPFASARGPARTTHERSPARRGAVFLR